MEINGDPIEIRASHINPYLIDGPDIFIVKRSQKAGPISPMLNLVDSGSMPLDGGNLIINTREEYDKAMSDSVAAKYVRPFRMGKELINNIGRWCLWLNDAEPNELRNSSYLREKIKACREYRENAPVKGDAYKHRTTPWLFRDDHQQDTNYLAIPKVFSEDREYMTCDWYTPDIIAGDMVYTCIDPKGLAFAIIESSMFMVWQKTVGGRLESRCRFSNTVVWNNLPLPELSDDMRIKVIEAGRGVLAARANHPGQSLADLYDPDFMPVDLRKAHEALDKVVDVAFGAKKPCRSNDERLTLLFANYAALTNQ
nr:type IIL restriction-modification enzyme MmeI [Bifidobacterium scaligerum]